MSGQLEPEPALGTAPTRGDNRGSAETETVRGGVCP